MSNPRCASLGLALLIVLLSALPASAQEPERAVAVDSTAAGPPISPRGAFLRSLVLPGWGQAYAGAQGRGAVFFTLTSGSAWMAYVARVQLRDAQRELDLLQESGAIEAGVDNEFVLARARHFEDWAALSLFLLFLGGADAYVAAYLADFDERVGVRPGADGSLRLEVGIPMGQRP